MKKKPPRPDSDPQARITALVQNLRKTEQQLQNLTVGEVDAVIHPGGHAYLLHKAQQKLQQTETAQRELAETQMAILNAMPAQVALLDSQGVILSVNDAWRRFAVGNGMQGPEFFVGQNYLQICDRATGDCAEEAHTAAAGIRRVLLGEAKDFNLEYPCHTPTEQRWFRLMVTPVRENQLSGAVVMHSDITRRKCAEEVLRKHQAELQILFDLMPALVWFKDTQNNILRINIRAANATGKPVEELEGRSMNEIYPQEAAKYYADDLEVIQSGKSKLGIVEVFRDAENQERWIQTDKAPYFDKDGKVIGIIVMAQDITERRMAEKKAAEQLELMSLASRVGKLGAWAAEYPGPKIKWSEEVYRIHEVEPDFQPDHDSTLSFFPPDSRRKLESAIASQQPYDLELEILTAKGNRRWVRSTSAIEMENGQVRRLYGVFQDFTDRKQAEARIRRLVDSHVQGVFFWKVSGEITDANDAFLKIVGYSREDLTEGRVSWAAMTPPEYAEYDRRALEEIAEKGFSSPYEKVYLRKDGTRVPVLIGAAIFEDNPSEGICFALNLSERKRMEARMRRLVDSNMQGVMFWNKDGRVFEANDRFLELVGYSREDLLEGRINWRELTPPEYAQADQRAMDEVAATGTCTPYEKEYRRKDGTRIHILIGSASFEDNPDEGVRFVLDLTERKKLEEQFFRSQRMESIGTLAGGIAHDLNNILAPIMMSIHLLKDFADDPQSRDILETIEVSARRGADIVRQVLSFARGVEGERIEVQPRHLLKDLEHIVKDTFPKDIRLKFTVPNNAWTILGDPTQIHQILLNLCVNARDAMPNGGSLTVAVENTALDEQYASMNLQAKVGRYVQISVTDSGVGMPREIIDKIFEPFFTTKELNRGTGLGLSTVMAIVKSHEGIINVYSEPGKGSTFKVYLPAVDTSSQAGKQATGKVRLVRGKGETILLVDDEASIIAITTKTLQSFGYRVLTAGDGAEGVAMYAGNQDQIAVVLTDMTMPVMDGVAMIHALRRINPGVKVIAASGLNANGSANRTAVLGVKHFLTKPYTAETLLRVLRSVLDETPTGPSH